MIHSELMHSTPQSCPGRNNVLSVGCENRILHPVIISPRSLGCFHCLEIEYPEIISTASVGYECHFGPIRTIHRLSIKTHSVSQLGSLSTRYGKLKQVPHHFKYDFFTRWMQVK